MSLKCLRYVDTVAIGARFVLSWLVSAEAGSKKKKRMQDENEKTV